MMPVVELDATDEALMADVGAALDAGGRKDVCTCAGFRRYVDGAAIVDVGVVVELFGGGLLKAIMTGLEVVVMVKVDQKFALSLWTLEVLYAAQ